MRSNIGPLPEGKFDQIMEKTQKTIFFRFWIWSPRSHIYQWWLDRGFLNEPQAFTIESYKFADIKKPHFEEKV